MDFETYASRKTLEARTAQLPGFSTAVDRGSELELRGVGNAWSCALFDGAFYTSVPPGGPLVNLVFVQSLDGNTVASDPLELGGGLTDKHLVYEGLSRVAADAVMTGASTIRMADMILSVWHPELVQLRTSLGKARHPAQIVVSQSGHFDMTRLVWNVPEIPVFVLVAGAGIDPLRRALQSRPWIQIIPVLPATGLAGALERLKEDFEISSISCIGGHVLATSLLDSGLIQDLYLTTSDRKAGQAGTPFYLGTKALSFDIALKKQGLGVEEGVVFEHRLVMRRDRKDFDIVHNL